MIFGSQKNNKTSLKGKRQESLENENSISLRGSIADFSKDTVQKTGEAFADIGKGMFEQILNQQENQENYQESNVEKPVQKKANLEGGTLFSFQRVEDEKQMQEIKELIEMIKQEVEMIKREDKTLMSQVSDIEKDTLKSSKEKPNLYNLNVLRSFQLILRLIRTQISKSSTWMEAFQTKKAKRGSLFAARSKKKGTQYSMSQELSNARSIQ